jgi:hypothetical protein
LLQHAVFLGIVALILMIIGNFGPQ